MYSEIWYCHSNLIGQSINESINQSIKIFNKTFKSLEHIFFWRMAVEFGKMELAQEICGCRHAGEAKRLGKTIADDEKRWEWEEKNVDFMKVLLDAKAEQCSEFRQCLLVNADKVFAEATPSKFWGTGMSPLDSELTSPGFWPGKNMLGALLTELASYLMTKDHENTMPFEDIDDPSTKDQDLDIVIPDTLDTNSSADHIDQIHKAEESTQESMEISTSGSPSASPPVSSHPNVPPTTENEPHTTKTAAITETAVPVQQPHVVIPPSKTSTSKGAVQRSRQCSSWMQHPRPRSHSLSNQRRDTRLDQDIRTAIMKSDLKRKNPESSPDEKSSTRDKMHKSDSSIT